MNPTWTQRIAEGFVVGVTASVMLVVFNSMNDARVELNESKEALLIQLELNQELLNETNEMKMQLSQLDTRLTRFQTSSVNIFDNLLLENSAPSESSPSKSTEPSEISPTSDTSELSLYTPPTNGGTVFVRDVGSIQQRIDQQRALIQ